MTKIKHLLFALCAILCLAGCDTEGEEIKTGFDSFNVSFASAAKDNYKIVFNGSEIQTTGYFPKDNPTGLLEVYNKQDNTLEFSQSINVTPNETIQLIEVDGKVDLYNDEKYAWFVPVLIISTSGEENRYTVTFNGQNLAFDGYSKMYIDRKNLTGKVDVKKDGTTVFSQEYTITPGGNLNIVESMDQTTGQMEYMILAGGSDEEEPASDNIGKVRFFYTKGDKLADVDSIRVVVSTFDQDKYWMTMDDKLVIPTDTITLKAGELSKYVSFDLARFRTESSAQPAGFFLDVWDAKPDGKQLSDHKVEMMTAVIESQGYSGDSYFKALYKFQTIRLMSVSGYIGAYPAFHQGTWETSPTK